MLCLPSFYLAPVAYYARLCRAHHVWIEQYDHYTKQTCRNRTVIASAKGREPLTIPVERSEGKTLMRDVRISEHGHWRHQHWNALVSAYKGSPFFEYYADDFRPFYESACPCRFLIDFNEALHQKVCELLDCVVETQRTESYFDPARYPDVEDLREAFSPKDPVHPVSGFTPLPYYQVFARRYGFLPNVGILDLLFNLGPEGLLLLLRSKKEAV